MSFYKYHVFFCTNKRENGEKSCEDFNSAAMRDYAKQRCKSLGLHKENQVRINTAGCLNRCELGPVMVVYPEDTWYTWVDEADIDEIIDSHLLKGQPVERLMLDPDNKAK
ncbi:(2Fe-2S) ferredoxin domain-containing protein [Thiolinea disciformis]|uniref:(2Fe-2S) ferredoxin domain-containing protein n=1 Tax=Thiolinea disciformis TaxID=125614 RepID=UPI000362FD8A|nr:ferredoxin [Thiolinea disciformis]